LIEWYNGLAPGELSVQSRTLLAIASRMPTNMRDLSRIKGVSPSLCRSHGAYLVSLLQRARATAPVTEALEPVDYASFDDFVREARLSLVRAELCAEIRMAPDLALPMALVRRMQQRVKASGDLRAASAELSGWRASLFGATLDRHLQRWASAAAS
jgi:ribonuclease D